MQRGARALVAMRETISSWRFSSRMAVHQRPWAVGSDSHVN